MGKEVPKNNGIRWTSKTIFVDIDTGEILTKHNAKTNYPQHYIQKVIDKKTVETILENAISPRKDGKTP